VTIRYLGLALFIFSLLVLSCLSLSRYAPNVPRSDVRLRRLAMGLLYDHWSSVTRLRTQMALTLALGGAAIWIIVATEHGPDDKKWAYGTLGTLLGYWVKS
jgi:hypothetical protein